MSVVLLYNGKSPHMVADYRCSGSTTYTDSLRKVFAIRGGLLGVIGNAAVITDVRRAVWAEPDIRKTRWPAKPYTALYLDRNKKLFEIDGGQIIPHERVILMAVGSGADLALGAAESWFRLHKITRRASLKPTQSQDLLRHAMHCTFKHSASCGGRILIKACDLRDLA